MKINMKFLYMSVQERRYVIIYILHENDENGNINMINNM